MSRRSSRAALRPSKRAASATATELPSIETVEQVEEALASGDADERAHALEQAGALLRSRLSREEVERVAAALERALADRASGVRVALGSAAAHLRHPAWERIAGALARDNNAYVRRAAEATIAQRTRSQERQLEEKIDEVLASIERLSPQRGSPAGSLPAAVRRLGRAYFTYTMSGVTHEARAILTGLKRSLTIAERELVGARKSPPRPWTQFRERAERRIATLEKILADAKDFSSQAPTERQRTSVRELAADALQLVRDQHDEHDGAPDVVATIEVDRNLEVNVPRHRLAQVLGNIVRNSFEAIERKGRVSITASATDDEVTVAVADTGCGISEADLAIVFLGGRSTKRGRRGPLENTGWGLTVAQGVVDDCGGRITIESAEGKGTTVQVTLPRALPDDGPDDDERETEEE